MTESVIEQALYICDHADNPRLALKELLVPNILPSVDYVARFGSPYVKSVAVMPTTRERLKQNIVDMWEEYQTTHTPVTKH